MIVLAAISQRSRKPAAAFAGAGIVFFPLHLFEVSCLVRSAPAQRESEGQECQQRSQAAFTGRLQGTDNQLS